MDADILGETMSDHSSFDAFVSTIAALRAPGGCPWDREQTHESIASNMIEEAYEAVHAIEQKDIPHIREELGDVLLQVVLQSQIAADAGEFTIDDVCEDVNRKMIRRHPHVFGEKHADDSDEVLTLWDEVKLQEGRNCDADGLLDSIPANFPALIQAQKISRKAASAGFEWNDIADVWEKVDEEIEELKSAYNEAIHFKNGKIDESADEAAFRNAQLELGDVLFALVNVGRRMGIDCERALRLSCTKFRQRWAFIEGAAIGMDKRVTDLDTDELNRLWELSKTMYR